MANNLQFKILIESSANLALGGWAGTLAGSLAKEAGFDDDKSYDVQLGLREAMNNIISHGYGDNEDKIFEVSIEVNQSDLTCILKDTGKNIPADRLGVFDLTKEEADEKFTGDVLSNLDGENTNAGMGMLLMRKIFDEINYSSINDENFLKLIIRF